MTSFGPIFVTFSGLKNVTSKAGFPWRIEGMAPQLYRVKRFEIETCLLKPKYEPRKKTLLLSILSYSAKGPWNKSLNFTKFTFPTKYVIPDKLKGWTLAESDIGCLIRIMVYEIIPVSLGSFFLISYILYTLNNQGPFFHCSYGHVWIQYPKMIHWWYGTLQKYTILP